MKNTTTQPTMPETPPPAQTTGDVPTTPLPLMTRHRVIFEQAKGHLEHTLGKAPSPEDLMRLWLASATPWDVARLFESAVLDLAGSDMLPLPGEDYNQALLAL